jgi:hypothetical protein
MINKNSNIQDLLNDPRVRGLKPITFKAFLILLEKADYENKIHDFSLRKQASEWSEKFQDTNLTANKNMVNSIIKELVKANLIKMNKNSKVVEIL